MRRITDLRSKKIKIEETPNIRNIDIEEPVVNTLDSDILHILQRYENRIKITTKLKKVKNIFKKSYERCLLHIEPIPFSIDIFPFINLETVVIKNCNELDLDVLSRRPLKTVYISNINKVYLSEDLKVEEIYFKNLKIDIDTVLKLISSPALKSINFNNVRILSKNTNPSDVILTESQQTRVTVTFNDQRNNSNSDGISTDSASQHMMSFTSVDELRYRQYNLEVQNYYQNDYISESIVNAIKSNGNIKACSFINTNVSLSSIIETKLLCLFHSFTYVYELNYVFVSYNTSTFNLLETNIEIDCKFLDLANLEKITVQNFLTFRGVDLSNLRSLEIVNSSLCDKMISKISNECTKLTEMGFFSCTFNNNTFYKLVEAFKNKVMKLSLKDSLIPLNSLDFLREKLNKCKVVLETDRVTLCDKL